MPTFKEISTFAYTNAPTGSELIQISPTKVCNLNDIGALAKNYKMNGVPFFMKSYINPHKGGNNTSSNPSITLYPGDLGRWYGTKPTSATINFDVASGTEANFSNMCMPPIVFWLPSSWIPTITFKNASLSSGGILKSMNWNVVPNGAQWSVITAQPLVSSQTWFFINVCHYTT